jgi:dipeptidyl aminopeptidase/acylaminoacyl peptidase
MARSTGRTVTLVLTLIVLTTGLGAAEPLRFEQVLQMRQISDLQISPDGTRIAFVVSEPIQGTEQDRNIWVLELDGRKIRQLTTANKIDRSPRWSPDSNTLAFVSHRLDEPQVFLISLKGGEATALTEHGSGVRAFEWAPDGKQIAFLASEPKTEEEEQKDKDKDDERVVDKDARPAELWSIAVKSREVRQLTRRPWRIESFTWAPGGTRLFLAATNHPQPELFTTRIYSLTLTDLDLDERARPAGPFGNLQISPDGSFLSYVGSRTDGPSPTDLFIQPLAGGERRNLTGSSVDRLINDYVWQNDGSLLVQASDGFTNVFYRVTADGEASRRAAFEATNAGGSFTAKADLIAFVGATFTQAPELWLSPRPAEAEKVSDFNASWKDMDLVEAERIHYPSFDGKRIEAAFLRPASSNGTPLPTIVLVHGGPSGRWSSRFHSWGQLLATRGYGVFYPNIRGSLGYGHDFLTLNRRDWGGGDYRDVMAGVDYLVEQGLADPDRLGIGGWSYGGYMAAWVVTQTHRFKASISGAPMTDLASEYGTEMSSINAYDTWYLGSPYENLELFVERSPVTHVSQAKTPTLILCGENDATDPIGQCWQFYRGLKRYNVETELVIYPREGHGIREEKHQLDLLERVVEWFDRFLS